MENCKTLNECIRFIKLARRLEMQPYHCIHYTLYWRCTLITQCKPHNKSYFNPDQFKTSYLYFFLAALPIGNTFGKKYVQMALLAFQKNFYQSTLKSMEVSCFNVLFFFSFIGLIQFYILFPI